MKTDTDLINEILIALKYCDFPPWGSPIALDRRDTALYIQQLIEKYKEQEIKVENSGGTEDDIKDLEKEIEDLENKIEDLEKEIKDLEEERKVWRRRLKIWRGN